MKEEEFFEKLVDCLRERFGEEYNVVRKEITKKNHVIFNGLIIMNKSQNVSPGIHMDLFWKAYCSGTSFDRIVDAIEEIYKREMPQYSIDVSFFTDFDSVKDRICYEIINAKENEELLKDLPHIRFLDLAICFYYLYNDADFGDGVISVHNLHLEMWHTSAEELLELAKKNTPRLLPWECVSLEEVMDGFDDPEAAGFLGTAISEGMDENVNLREEMDAFLAKMPMQVLSNVKKLQGSVCVLYPGVIDELAEKLGGSLYLIPSSVHEVILMTDSGVDAEELKNIVHVINETQVAPEDVLSDSLYYYDRVEKSFRIV